MNGVDDRNDPLNQTIIAGGVTLKDGNCPKCGSGEVYSGAGLLLKGGPFASNSIPVSLTSLAPMDNYVCVNCGYVEHYISEPSKLKEISKKWDKAASEKDDEPSGE